MWVKTGDGVYHHISHVVVDVTGRKAKLYLAGDKRRYLPLRGDDAAKLVEQLERDSVDATIIRRMRNAA